MCRCTPEIRTPLCGKADCVWPGSKPANARDNHNTEGYMKLYLAGPMTGLPQFNFPLFDRVAAELRAAGMQIISPAELDSPAVREAALASVDGKLHGDKIAGESWGEILARDVRIVADEVAGVIVLPNWERSRGARLEVFVALLCSKPIYSYAHRMQELSRVEIMLAIAQSFIEGATLVLPRRAA